MVVVVVMVLFNPFRGIRARRNFADTQQSGHATRSGPDTKDRRSNSGVARGEDKWGHAPWGAPVHFLQAFKNSF